ncbi:MAG: ATP dependent DNA helicase [Podoviridae sp. ctLUJ1]|nr:MAG: ATP dependent DNA helicase [Podoviridae sp. ctLUJ1]
MNRATNLASHVGATKDQIDALNLFKAWVENQLLMPEPSKPFILKAGAGNGKSWVTANLLLPYLKTFPQIYCALTTTTNQACDSLEAMANTNSNGKVEAACTIHKYLGLTPKDGVKPLNPKGFENSPYSMNCVAMFQNYGKTRIIIVDEAFRMDDWLLKTLNYLRPDDLKVYIGDPYQTPPIGLPRSPIEDFTEDNAVITTLHSSPRFTMNTKNLHLKPLVDMLRLAVQYKEEYYTDLLPTESVDGISVVKVQALHRKVEDYAKLDTPPPLNELCILSASRNRAAFLMHAVITLRARADNAPSIIHPLEKCEVAYTFGHDVPYEYSNNKTAYYLPSGIAINYENNALTQKVARDFFDRKHPQFIDKLNAIGIIFHISKDKKQIHVLISNIQEVRLTSEIMRALWAMASSLGVFIIFVRPAFIKTIHAAQGITSKEVWIDMKSIFDWKGDKDMVRRLLYTSISRCSDKLFLVG